MIVYLIACNYDVLNKL